MNRPSNPNPAQSATFVILEDDLLAANELREGLTESGFVALGSFTRGEDLLEKVEGLNPDILLVDISLAGKLDGIETVMRLPKTLHSRVIFLTGDNDEETLRRAILLRPHAYLLKPLETIDVRSTILTTLARDPAVEAEVMEVGDVGEVAQDSRQPFQLMMAFSHFSPFGQEMISKLSSRSVIKEGGAGSIIRHQGQRSSSVFMMLSGLAICSRQNSDGRQLTVYAAGAGDPFGLMLALPTIDDQFSVRLTVNSKYLTFPVEDVIHVINSSPTFAKFILDRMGKLVAELSDFSAMIAYSRVEERLIRKLLTLLDSIGRPLGGDKGTKVFITRKELSELAGTTVESAIRATKNLERQGVLDLTRPGIIVVPSKSALLEALHAGV